MIFFLGLGRDLRCHLLSGGQQKTCDEWETAGFKAFGFSAAKLIRYWPQNGTVPLDQFACCRLPCEGSLRGKSCQVMS
jgi:hypothetical protein